MGEGLGRLGEVNGVDLTTGLVGYISTRVLL